MRRRKGQTEQFDLEAELRTLRATPRPDFMHALAEDVRGRSRPAPVRSPRGRLGLAVALTGLMIVAIASFGGLGYASSVAREAAKKVEKVAPTKAAAPRAVNSAAAAQYKKFTPPKPKPKAAVLAVTKPVPAKPAAAAVPAKATLPFTGLALWLPTVLGLLLVATGLALRSLGRRRGSKA
jgi:hypothetical protein